MEVLATIKRANQSTTSEVYPVYFLHFSAEAYKNGALGHDSDLAYRFVAPEKYLEDNKKVLQHLFSDAYADEKPRFFITPKS